jgi:hypothetical protein
MYNIGEGHMNLKKMDSYAKKRDYQAASIFGAGIISHTSIEKQRKKRLPMSKT